MTYIANAHQMRELDRRSIEELQIPGIVLMENAGRESVRFLSQFWPDFHDVEVTILAGKGNNGGDGFVVGRHLWNRGADVLIFLIGSLNTLHGDAKTNAQIAVNMGIPVFEIDLNSDPEELEEALFNANIIVDAIFGTGLTKAIEGKYSEIIDIINRSPAFTLSLDIPSGIFADRSDIVGSTVYANLTVTFGLPKPGLLLYPAAKAVGQLAVADISIPQELLIESELEGSILKPQDFHNVFLPRPQDSHK